VAGEVLETLLLKKRLVVVIDQSGGILGAGLRQDVLPVRFDCLKANKQSVCDLLVRTTEHNKTEHFNFPNAQLMIVHHKGIPPLVVYDSGRRNDVSDFDIQIQMKRFSNWPHRPDQFMYTLQKELFSF